MKKLLFLVIAIFLFFLASPISWAQESQEPIKWLIGKWIGVIEARDQTRTLEVTKIGESIITGNISKIDAHGLYGITNGKMSRIPLIITIEKGQVQLSFETQAQTDILLNRVNDGRMDGSFHPLKGSLKSIRFWKQEDRPIPDIDPKLKALLGIWQGKWSSGLEARLTVAFIDSDATSVRYEYGSLFDDRGRIGASWSWFNATVNKNGSFKFNSFDARLTFNFKSSSGGLFGDISGIPEYLSIKMNRIDPTDKLRPLN